jgi:hypothetical protein
MGRYVHVQELAGPPPHFQVCMDRRGVGAHFGLYVHIRTAALVAQYADITGKSHEDVVKDLDIDA